MIINYGLYYSLILPQVNEWYHLVAVCWRDDLSTWKKSSWPCQQGKAHFILYSDTMKYIFFVSTVLRRSCGNCSALQAVCFTSRGLPRDTCFTIVNISGCLILAMGPLYPWHPASVPRLLVCLWVLYTLGSLLQFPVSLSAYESSILWCDRGCYA